MVQRELLHDLVERSRERVVQVRAGHNVLRVLHQQQLHAPQLSMSTSLPLLHPAPLLAKASKHKTLAAQVADDHNIGRQRRRALPRLAKDAMELPEGATSFEQYQNFMASKIFREQAIHLQNRRVALVPQDDLLKKLATVCAAALKEMENMEEAPAVRESLHSKLLRAMALLRRGRAFEQVKTLAPPPPPTYGDIKNAHVAFLQFKNDDGSTKQKRVHPAGLQDGNASNKTPIHFGDRICLLSSSSNLPLAVGPDGRSHSAPDSSVGPHMTFTIVDFRSPARYDEVTATDDFWLPSLLSDTNYYLGCPGWLDDERRLSGQQRFRLVAMKALTPSREYYGDDAATREHAIETNEGIMRLARWRIVRYKPRTHKQLGGTTDHSGVDDEHDVNDAMLNCSTVYLVLSDFALVYDKRHKRGVAVRVASEPPSGVAIVRLPACARWQVRILQRSGGLNYLKELELAMAAVTGNFQNEDGARVEWLREKQEKMASNDRRIRAKTRLVSDARRQYDLIVSQSNSKLEQIERQKGAQSTGYFQRRLEALENMESGHQLHEIIHLKHQQLHRVVELPHI
ncbi:uncharacterized protein PITG_01948 [Phytophthora infestans T30-4]|uniref:Uncharacterized protein n=1 Tax=Phytophthora infestans (strain T30-4) TaxID=403677 RepID=D0MUH3_PHYIT|nr:uncharacterized protein PITG_01948 [Phytophthora infestans T30-4]EEY61620.1 conserved hypothetical protein [Phytophthora infestans T30-4]|eukprot:XP_002908537.1 conserved hypothetical protein [Phytophthora infestans T30-4]